MKVTQNLTSYNDKQIVSEQNEIRQEIEELKNTNSRFLDNFTASKVMNPVLLDQKSVFFYGEPESISANAKSSEDLNFDLGTGKFTVEYDGFYHLSIFLSPIDRVRPD